LHAAGGGLAVAADRATLRRAGASEAAWPRLHRAAIVSLGLWFLIVLAGTALTLDA
jgi:hypothetical protein